MAADLGLLFQPQAPAGAMAGYQQGVTNAKSLMDLERSGIDSRKAAFDLNKEQQMLPHELMIKQRDATNAKQDMTQPMMDARQQGYLADNKKKEADALKAFYEAETSQQLEIMKRQKAGMQQLFEMAITKGSQGTSGAQLIPMLDDMFDKLPQEQKTQWENSRMEFANYSPEQLVSEATKVLQQLHQVTPEFMLEKFKAETQMKLQQLQNSGNIKAAGIRSSADRKPTEREEVINAGRRELIAAGVDPKKVNAGEYDYKILTSYKSVEQAYNYSDGNMGTKKSPGDLSEVYGGRPTGKTLTPQQREELIKKLQGK